MAHTLGLNSVDRNNGCNGSLVEEIKELVKAVGILAVKMEVVLSIPEAKRSKTTRQLHLEQDNMPVEMALGFNWCTQIHTSLQWRLDHIQNVLLRYSRKTESSIN